jgi:hypothetical protein
MRRLVVVAVSACALTLAMPASAHAQFGGLVRRAAERVVKKDNPSSDQPRMDEATVTHMLAGLTEEAKVADSIGRATLAQHAGVIGEVDSFLKRWAVYSTALVDAHRAQVEYQSCVSGPSQELASMAQAPSASPPPGSMALAQRMESMSDEEREAFQAKLDKLEKEAKAAEKSGNVAEQQRIRAEVGKLTGVSVTPAAGAPRRSQADIKRMQDAGTRMQQCRAPQPLTVQPPEPIMVRPVVSDNGAATLAASATREISDSADAQAYLMSLRSMQVGNAPIGRGAQAAGMATGRYSLVRERMLLIYASAAMRGESGPPDGISDEEYQALQAHRSEIIAVSQRLQRLGAF